ncbi:hypothetical protein Mal15_26650 [Stieleria maiorica]|uniref:Uncharacterized protein n=1 Tax=Stieleria maiorica TaxID=2795974 RepID=A0A5B9MF42_9BACT|nr:hypothetical protein Mal15_26650 [Stieleria maiorica]
MLTVSSKSRDTEFLTKGRTNRIDHEKVFTFKLEYILGSMCSSQNVRDGDVSVKEVELES